MVEPRQRLGVGFIGDDMLTLEKPPLCPNCKAPLHLVPVIPRAGVLAERTYECRVCKITVVEPLQPPVQE